MSSFRDSLGREWFLELNLGEVERLKSSDIKLDVLQLADEKAALHVAERLRDVSTLAEVCCFLTQAQQATKSVDRESFMAGISGDVIDAMSDAIEAAITHFFRSSQRPKVAAALAKYRELEQKQVAQQVRLMDSPKTNAAIDRLLAEAEEKALDEMEKRLRLPNSTGSATNSAAS